jgi:hypothetical protein
MALHHPPQVARTGAAQDRGRRRSAGPAEQPFDHGHRCEQPFGAVVRQRGQHRRDLVA